jgi:hypothetical protein
MRHCVALLKTLLTNAKIVVHVKPAFETSSNDVKKVSSSSGSGQVDYMGAGCGGLTAEITSISSRSA